MDTLTTTDIAKEWKKSIKSVDRWIGVGYSKDKIRLKAKRRGRGYLIERKDWEAFKYAVNRLYVKKEAA